MEPKTFPCLSLDASLVADVARQGHAEGEGDVGGTPTTATQTEITAA